MELLQSLHCCFPDSWPESPSEPRWAKGIGFQQHGSPVYLKQVPMQKRLIGSFGSDNDTRSTQFSLSESNVFDVQHHKEPPYLDAAIYSDSMAYSENLASTIEQSSEVFEADEEERQKCPVISNGSAPTPGTETESSTPYFLEPLAHAPEAHYENKNLAARPELRLLAKCFQSHDDYPNLVNADTEVEAVDLQWPVGMHDAGAFITTDTTTSKGQSEQFSSCTSKRVKVSSHRRDQQFFKELAQSNSWRTTVASTQPKADVIAPPRVSRGTVMITHE